MQPLPPILTKPVDELPIAKELANFMIHYGYENLEQLIKEGTPKLQRTKGFNILCFESLLNILDRHNCMDLLSED